MIVKIVCLLLWAARSESLSITLIQTIERTLEKSPEVSIAQKELDIVALNEPLLDSINDPQLRLSASFADDRTPRLLPEIQGRFAKTSKLDLSIDQKFLMGTEAQIFYKTDHIKSPSLFKSIDPSVESRLGFQISQPLLRHFLGRPDKLRRKKSKAQAAQALAHFKQTQANAALKSALAYLELYAAQNTIAINEAAVKDAQDLRDNYKEKRKY